jgi:ribosomal protein L2
MLVRLMPPKARGIVMNLTNHLHGDGEGLASIGKKKTINSLGVELKEVLDIEIIYFVSL